MNEASMERTLLVTVKLSFDKSTWDVLEQERELKALAMAAGAEVVAGEICQRASLTADFYIGDGKANEIAGIVREKQIELVIFNNDLSATQLRNLENLVCARVIDRTQLILDIFARRARSPEGNAQVELAQLEYLLPRLAGRGVELSRLGGGIGTRGPGEQKLEVDRRRIRDRIAFLKRDLVSLKSRRNALRQRRQEHSLPTVALVGYTSAGKSTLFNTLSGARQAVSRGLFTTLDPLVRAIALSNNQKVLISDTVGFIKKLPHHLVEAFKATLDEVTQADLLLHVLDTASTELAGQYDSVCDVLRQLNAEQKNNILVFNKIDLIEDKAFLERLARDYPESFFISALAGENIEALLCAIEHKLSFYFSEITLILPSGRMDLVDLIYSEGQVKRIDYLSDGVHVEAVLPFVLAQKLKAYACPVK